LSKYKIPLVILAGGKSSRMQKDKTLLPFGEFENITQYQVSKFQNKFEEIYISTKQIDKFGKEYNYIIDKNNTYAPTISIISSFEQLKVDNIFFLSVDTPFISFDTIDKLLINHNSIVTIAKTQFSHALCGVYSKEFLPILNSYINDDFHKLNFILKNIDTKYIQFESEEDFLNLNYKDDYQKALDIYNSK
jgi:molybdopterin-guanine dinucleotide biosynthesis protein A